MANLRGLADELEEAMEPFTTAAHNLGINPCGRKN